MKYYTYLIIPTNPNYNFFGKVYFGKHKQAKENDNYICSSRIISKWCRKHPNEYVKLILNYYSSEEELNKAEFDLIHPHLGKDWCLNLKEGGEGGTPVESVRLSISKNKKGKPQPWNSHPQSDETKEKRSKSMKDKNKGKERTIIQRDNISKTTQEAMKRPEVHAKLGSGIRGKHKIWDNKELNIFHYE